MIDCQMKNQYFGGMSYDKTITDFLRIQLQASFGERLKKVILFGSRARGDADEDSDYDVLVLLENCTKADNETLIDIAVAGLLEFEVALSLFSFAADSLERYPFEPMFMNIRREGIEL
ncbi:MAG: nucleotidyltransferase domain-containing protein [Candidatus Kapabacteria bacterium]|nr:nucleotidyltransferase domain-containing protein [Candidatus Kapabacteria bacterium]